MQMPDAYSNGQSLYIESWIKEEKREENTWSIYNNTKRRKNKNTLCPETKKTFQIGNRWIAYIWVCNKSCLLFYWYRKRKEDREKKGKRWWWWWWFYSYTSLYMKREFSYLFFLSLNPEVSIPDRRGSSVPQDLSENIVHSFLLLHHCSDNHHL